MEIDFITIRSSAGLKFQKLSHLVTYEFLKTSVCGVVIQNTIEFERDDSMFFFQAGWIDNSDQFMLNFSKKVQRNGEKSSRTLTTESFQAKQEYKQQLGSNCFIFSIID